MDFTKVIKPDFLDMLKVKPIIWLFFILKYQQVMIFKINSICYYN